MNDIGKIKLARYHGKTRPEDCPAFYVELYDLYVKYAGGLIGRQDVQHTDLPWIGAISEMLKRRDETMQLLTSRLQAVEARLADDETTVSMSVGGDDTDNVVVEKARIDYRTKEGRAAKAAMAGAGV